MMVHIEGKGLVSPSPVKRKLATADIRILAEEAMRRTQYRRYCGSQDQWKRGLLSGCDIPAVGRLDGTALVVLVGLVGEYACGDYLNERIGESIFAVDLRLLYRGDNGIDLRGCGLTAQVKTRQYTSRKETLWRRVTAQKRIVSFTTDIGICCYWDKQFSVHLLGWQWCRKLRSACEFAESDRGEHFNLIVYDSLLEPMESLVLELKDRRDAN